MILPPLSLYVHIPWCVRKCPYCDFNSHESKDIPEAEYVAALLRDLDQDLHLIQGRKLRSIFFGGGTPSLFKAKSIGRVLEAAERHIGFEETVEITLETNPGTAEYHQLEGYRSAGVNRLSFGIQSFDDQHLQTLGRIHSGHEARVAYAAARQAGFQNINLDLMHGLPGQTLADARADIEQAIALSPEHLSWYQLTLEPNTLFAARPPDVYRVSQVDRYVSCPFRYFAEHVPDAVMAVEDHGVGFRVTGVGNADSAAYPTTQILDFGSHPNTTRYLAQMMGIPPLNISYSNQPATDHDVLVILGNDWQIPTPTP